MLPPRYLEGLSDELADIYAQLETDILRDMAQRIAKLGKITDGAKWQAQMLNEAGGLKQNISKILKNYDGKITREIQAACTDALKKSAAADNRIFKAATGRTVSASNAQSMLALTQKCRSDLSRLTLTTAATSQQQFVQQANRVYMDVQSGAFDYDTAMKSAADELAKRGITTVQYENGKPVTRTIESAVRMNILTGINQTAATMTMNNCTELDCDLVEISAHIGARPDHEAWQGGIYSLSGKSDKYPPFSVCGFGAADGICGINCRHSFYPYFEGMEKHWTQDDLDELAAEKVTCNGKEMTRYEGEQQLRKIERTVRAYKRRALTEEAAGVDSTAARRKLGEWQAAARDFTKQTGIKRDSAREFVGAANGKQPAGIRTMTAGGRSIPITETDAAVQAVSAFPEEIWQEKSPGVFIAKNREPKNKEQQKIFKKEYEMALILAQNGHTVYMLPETSAGKNPDVIMDGVKTEMKNITGGESAVSHRFRESMKQGENSFLKIDRDIPTERIKQLFYGVIKDVEKKESKEYTGTIYCYITKEKKLYCWNKKDLK